VVLVNRRARGFPSISVDQRQIISFTIDHLIALGHRRITVPVGPSGYWSTRERMRALSDDDRVIALRGFEPTYEGGRKLCRSVADSDATAVAAFNDVMALGLVAEATASGLSIPEDLSVVGSDDIPAAAMSVPSLTTIRTPIEMLGAGAVELLTGGPELSRSTRSVSPELIVRNSTAPHRRRSDR
jgi:DNA-binding LacI/PurR family transcriptional regulator